MLFAATVLFVGATVAPIARAKSVEATCRVESPVDGSLWIATSGDGLFRLGRNGRTVRYTAQGGQLSSNSIKWIAFDNQKQLWILEEGGTFRTYSSVNGFQEKTNLPLGIQAAVMGNKKEFLIIANSEALFKLDIDSEAVEKLADISVMPLSMSLSNNEQEIWVFSDKSTQKFSISGANSEWDDLPYIINSLPFEYETNLQSTSVEARSSVSMWLVICLIVAAYFIGWFIRGQFIVRIKEIPDANHDFATSSDALVKASGSCDTAKVANISTGEFTKRVLSLINENIADPDFDVEKIASITGLSRIHVNRKLKAEGSDSPSALIKSARMSMASDLLKQHKLTVSLISERCGFRTPSYFATAFKEYFGTSPSDFS